MQSEYERELAEYIAMIRKNPRAKTPGGRHMAYVAEGFGRRPRKQANVAFNKVSRLTQSSRLRRDMANSVTEQMATFRVWSRQRSRQGRRASRPPSRDDEPARVEPVRIGPDSNVFDPELAMAAAQAAEATMSVKAILADRLVGEGRREEPQVVDLGGGGGRVEQAMRAAYLHQRIERVVRKTLKLERAEKSPSRPSLPKLDDSARDQVLRDLDRLDGSHQWRAKAREALTWPSIADLTARPKRWVETRLIDAVVGGAPDVAARHLRALRLFPETAPASVGGAVRSAVSRLRQHSLDAGWIASRLSELRASGSTEPLVVTSARLLLTTRARDREAGRLSLHADVLISRDASAHGGHAGGHAGCLCVLRDAGASIEDLDGAGWAAIHHAAHAGDAGVVRLLVSRLGADIEARAPDGASPLHLAVECPNRTSPRPLCHSRAAPSRRHDCAQVQTLF